MEDAMMHWGTSGWGWGMELGWIHMIIFWAVIIIAVVYLVKLIDKKSDSEILHEPPLDTIKRRYAMTSGVRVQNTYVCSNQPIPLCNNFRRLHIRLNDNTFWAMTVNDFLPKLVFCDDSFR